MGESIKMYKVYEKLEVRGLPAFKTLLGTFKYIRDAELFMNVKTENEAFDKVQSRRSYFIFEE